METKRCSKCGEILPHSAFNKDKSYKDGLHRHCKNCANTYHKLYSAKHKEKYRQYRQSWRVKNPEKIKALSDKYYNILTNANVAKILKIPTSVLPEELYQMKKSAILLGRELKASQISETI